MRALLLIALLTAQISSVHAEECKGKYMRLLTALNRYCVLTAASQKESGATCKYDCLISKETVPKPAGAACPLTVKQRLYDDSTTEIVMEATRLPADRPVYH